MDDVFNSWHRTAVNRRLFGVFFYTRILATNNAHAMDLVRTALSTRTTDDLKALFKSSAPRKSTGATSKRCLSARVSPADGAILEPGGFRQTKSETSLCFITGRRGALEPDCGCLFVFGCYLLNSCGKGAVRSVVTWSFQSPRRQ